MDSTLIIGAGAVVGLLVGMVGIGGGAVMTPLLILGFGVSPVTAVSTDLWFAALTKLVASYFHNTKGGVDWQIVKRLWMGSIPATILTLVWIAWSPVISQSQTSQLTLIQAIISIAVLLTAIGLLFKDKLHAMGRNFRLRDKVRFKVLQAPLTILSGMVLGVLVTLTSIGAGALGVIILSYLYPLRLTPVRLVATDLAHAVPLSMFAALGYSIYGVVDWSLLFMMLLGSLPAVWVGVKLAHLLSQTFIRWFLALLLLGIGLKLLISTF